MSIINGSLKGAIRKYYTENHSLGVLLIDEQDYMFNDPENIEHFNRNMKQKDLLEFTNSLGIPSWNIEYFPSIKMKKISLYRTSPLLSKLCKNSIAKRDRNAFGKCYVTNFFGATSLKFLLDKELKKSNITIIIVMGGDARCCLKETVSGSLTKSGAIQSGWIVLTARSILYGVNKRLLPEYKTAQCLAHSIKLSNVINDPDFDWLLEPGVRFYTEL